MCISIESPNDRKGRRVILASEVEKQPRIPSTTKHICDQIGSWNGMVEKSKKLSLECQMIR
jgi:hypothetical protein